MEVMKHTRTHQPLSSEDPLDTSANHFLRSSPPSPASPYDTASLWSHISYSYVLPLLRLGATRPLVQSDLPPLPTHDDCEVLSSNLQREWKKEKQRLQPSLWAAIYRAFKRDFYEAGLFTLLEHAMIIVQPCLLGALLSWMNEGGEGRRLVDGLAWSFLLRPRRWEGLR